MCFYLGVFLFFVFWSYDLSLYYNFCWWYEINQAQGWPWQIVRGISSDLRHYRSWVHYLLSSIFRSSSNIANHGFEPANSNIKSMRITLGLPTIQHDEVVITKKMSKCQRKETGWRRRLQHPTSPPFLPISYITNLIKNKEMIILILSKENVKWEVAESTSSLAKKPDLANSRKRVRHVFRSGIALSGGEMKCVR